MFLIKKMPHFLVIKSWNTFVRIYESNWILCLFLHVYFERKFPFFSAWKIHGTCRIYFFANISAIFRKFYRWIKFVSSFNYFEIFISIWNFNERRCWRKIQKLVSSSLYFHSFPFGNVGKRRRVLIVAIKSVKSVYDLGFPFSYAWENVRINPEHKNFKMF